MEQLVLSCLESRVEENRHIYGRFLLGVFKNGDALTVATALRRSLLSQVESVAIIALDIQGVSHEFSTVAGVRESVLELTLNFQQIILRTENTLKSTQVGYLQIQGPKVVYANDLKLPKGIELVDPTQYIATVARDGLLIVKFLIATNAHNKHLRINNSQINSQQLRQVKKVLDGKHFQSQTCLQNILPLDSFISPVNRVNFTVQKDDLFNQTRERVCIEIWTNGSLHPRQALNQAVFSLVAIFSAFRNVTHLDSHSFGLVGFGSGFGFAVVCEANQEQTKQSKPQANHRQTKLSSLSQPDVNKRNLSYQSKALVQGVRPSLTTSNLLKLAPTKTKFLEDNEVGSTGVLRSRTTEFSVLYKTNLEKMSLLSSDISNLSLSLKTYIFLKQKGINKLEHLLKHSQKKLLDLVNGNKNMYYDIKRCLLNLGLSNL